jgi:hypothetical protein
MEPETAAVRALQIEPATAAVRVGQVGDAAAVSPDRGGRLYS